MLQWYQCAIKVSKTGWKGIEVAWDEDLLGIMGRSLVACCAVIHTQLTHLRVPQILCACYRISSSCRSCSWKGYLGLLLSNANGRQQLYQNGSWYWGLLAHWIWVQQVQVSRGIGKGRKVAHINDQTRYHLKDVIVGKIYFLLVRIKIKTMELAIIRRETTGAGKLRRERMG